MTFSSPRALRRGAVAAGLLSALGGTLGATTASAVPVSVTLNYICTFPLIKPEPLQLKISSDIPDKVAVDTSTGAFVINATAGVSAGAVVGLRAVGTTTIEGSAEASSALVSPDGSSLPLRVPTKVAKTNVPASGSFDTVAVGKTPPLAFRKPGRTKVTIGDLVLNLTPRLIDGTLTGLDTFETECKQVPGQNNLLANIDVGDGADSQGPTKPGLIIGTPSPASVALTWPASTDNIGVTGYDVFQDGVKIQSVVGPAAAVSGLTASTNYKFKVQAHDAAGNPSPFSDEVTVTTAPAGGTVNYAYNFVGNATLKTLVKGSVPLTGTINANLDSASKAFTGDLALNPATANLTALGFLPVAARIAFVSTAPTTGTLKDGILKSDSKVRIKLPRVTLFGLELAGGAGCQSKAISSIALTSTQAFFDPTKGGPIAGTFSISDLVNCGFLTGIVSPLTAGKGNAIVLNLTPKPTV